ncbi:unnamed protein product [Caretta caretta]
MVGSSLLPRSLSTFHPTLCPPHCVLHETREGTVVKEKANLSLISAEQRRPIKTVLIYKITADTEDWENEGLLEILEHLERLQNSEVPVASQQTKQTMKHQEIT